MKAVKQITNYVKASLSELKKVTWPTQKTTLRLTGLVILISLTVMAFLGIIDYLLSTALEKLLSI
jgi:preprotein translocase SecE subunit